VSLQRGYDITKAGQEAGPYFVISSSGPNSTHCKSMVKGPGVVIGRKGTLGTVFYAPRDYWPHDTTLWGKDFHGNHERYTYYLLKTLRLEQYDSGASNPTLNRNHIHTLPVKCPPWDTQRRIAAILSAYDDLIENNARRIQILEEMARMLYREWFGKFLCPAENDVPIPSGWRRAQVADIAYDTRESVDPSQLDPGTPYVGLEHIPRRSLGLSEWGRASDMNSTKLRFSKGDILFGKIRPYFHKVAVAPTDGVCSSDTIVIRPTSPEFYGLVVCCVSSDDFVQQSVQSSNGTKMPRANWGVMLKYPVVIPSKQQLEEFNATIVAFVDGITNLTYKNRNLRQTRDLLLPKLVSGEVDVSNLDIAVAVEQTEGIV